jgi:hypothetical protein
MTSARARFRQLVETLVVLMLSYVPLSASEWRTVSLPARPLNIAENNGSMWVCGSDELVAVSADGGKTWITKHNVKSGGVLLTLGFSDRKFGYAAGTGGIILTTNDGGDTWNPLSAPSQTIYEASFSDQKHGIIQTPRTIYTTTDGGSTWTPVQIDLANEELKGFKYALTVLAVDATHMAIVLSEGNSAAYPYKLLLTKDGGSKWNVSDVPSTGLSRLVAHDGEYWFTGMEVIEKDKPGGGYGVPLVMHSPDGEKWTHLTRWSKHEFSECNFQGCLYWDGAGVQLPPETPPKFWVFAPEKVVTAKWAIANGSICSVGPDLRCAGVTQTETMPPYLDSSVPIPPPIAAPPLDAPPIQGLQCLSCEFERIMVTPDYQGVAEVELKLHIGLNGLVEQAEIIRATNPTIGERLAASAKNWIFVPFVKDGAVHPAITNIKLRVQAIKSK